MMDFKKGNVALVVLVVIVVLGGGFLLLSKNGGSPTEDTESMEKMDGENEEVHNGQMMTEEEKVMTDGETEMMAKTDEVGSPDTSKDVFRDDEMELAFSGSVLAGSISPLIDFNKADYDKALKEKKLVVLYFYANWCPTCKQEMSSATLPTFNELANKNVVGFRVNYNDNQTDSNEKALAKEFGVAYQHTKVFLKNGERILKSPESWDKGRYLEEVAKGLE